MKLIITDSATLRYNNDVSLDIFSSFGEVECYDSITHEELKTAARDADIILCNKTIIDKEIMIAAPKLKYIGLFATGYNNIDIDFAKERGITVCNAGSYSTNAVAQQVFAYILSHFSAAEKYNDFVKKGGWISSPTFSMLCYPTDEIDGKTIGIIGYGSIGKKVAKIALSFDMNVLVCTRTVREDPSVTFVTLDKLLCESDIITVHCPLNPESHKMFDRDAFAKMKNGAYFINTARGGVLEESALYEALASGKLSGAAIDVLETEPMKKDCVLQNAPNIIITPHTAWAPITTRLRLMKTVADNIKAYISGNPTNKVS